MNCAENNLIGPSRRRCRGDTRREGGSVQHRRIAAHAESSRRRRHRSSASMCSSNSSHVISTGRQMRKEALLAVVGAALAASSQVQHVEAFISLHSVSRKVRSGGCTYRRRGRTTSTSFLTSTQESIPMADEDERNFSSNTDAGRSNAIVDSASFSFGDTLTADATTLPSTLPSPGDRGSKSKSLTTTTSGIRYGPPPPSTSSASTNLQNAKSANDGSNKSLLERLTSLSTFASALCVLDCTILPLITVALPLLGLTAAGSSSLAHTLHHLGHSLALYFVLPVGTFTTTVAYANHRSVVKSLPGIFGLALIYLSNCSGASLHLHTATVGEMTGGLNPLVQMVPHDVLHAISDGDGWMHRAVNELGCALMLGGNWLGKRTAGAAGEDGEGGACFVPGCGRIECEVDGEGVDNIEEISFFRVERPD